jgi:two-component system sensor histidine kinase DegS
MSKTKELISYLPEFMQKYHFWLIALMFLVIGVIHYGPQLNWWIPLDINWFPLRERYTFERILLLVPVTYAGYIHGLKGGIIGLAVACIIMIPGALSLSILGIYAVVQSIGIIFVGALINYLVYLNNIRIARRRDVYEMLAKIIDGSTVPAFVIDKNHKVTYWNKALESLSGIKREDIVGTSDQWRAFYNRERNVMADLIVQGADEAEIKKLYNVAVKSHLLENAYEAEYFFPELGSNGKWLYFTVSPIRDSKGEIVAAIETLFDVTERKNAEENLKYYLKEITKAQEEERKRIARELHDDTVQNLIALLHQLENILNDKTGLPLKEAQILWGFYERIRDVIQGVRHFSRDLRPSILDDLGLLPALEWVTENLKTNYWITCTLRVVGEQRRLATEVELMLFRIVQEGLSNVAKHASASTAEVKIEFTKDKVLLAISDNGVGFRVPPNFNYWPHSGKLGLTGLNERVQLLNGVLEIKSEPGKGTTVYIEAPV